MTVLLAALIIYGACCAINKDASKMPASPNNITFVDTSPSRFDVYGYEHAGHKYIVFILPGHGIQALEEKP